MRILQLTDDLERGGVQRVVVGLANGLAAAGDEVFVAAGDGPLWADLRGVGGAPQRAFRKPGVREVVHSATRLRTLVSELGIEIVDVHQRRLALIATHTLRRTNTIIIEHVHSRFDDHRWLSYRAPTLVAVGTDVAHSLKETYRKQYQRVIQINNGVPDPFPDGGIPVLPPAKPLRLVAIGRLVKEKDPWFFSKIVKNLRSLGVDVKATWVGDGPLRRDVRSNTVVDWVGETTDVTSYLIRSHALVVTSLREGLPLVAIEALASGRPVLTRDVGSCADVVRPGRSGILWPLNDSPEKAARLLINNLGLLDAAKARERLSTLGERARELYEREFTLEKMVVETRSLYKRVVCECGKAPC